MIIYNTYSVRSQQQDSKILRRRMAGYRAPIRRGDLVDGASAMDAAAMTKYRVMCNNILVFVSKVDR